MKCKFVSAAVAALAFASCSGPVGVEPVQNGELVDFQISIDGLQTKATTTDGEAVVNDIQVFVFGAASKQLEAYKSEASGSVNLSVFTGEKIIYALVNAPAISGVNTYTAFSEKVSYLKDNSLNDFVMEGIRTKTIASTKDTAVVRVNRLASKVSLMSVTNQLEGNYKDLSFAINKVYLINVLGQAKYVGNVTGLTGTETWHSKSAYTPEAETSIPALTYEEFAAPVSVSDKTPYTVPHYFYCYPNPTAKSADKSDKTWSVRCTRLVVEISIGGVNYYYPVTIPSMKQNAEYKVSLTVTRPGSTDPDIPFEEDAASVSVQVVDWGTGGTIDEVI